MSPEQALGVLLAHLVGDYVIQSDWMADEKTRRWWPAVVHGVSYTLPYVLVTQSWLALLVIASTHVVIDHYRLARYLVWAKNQLVPKRYRYPLAHADGSGYHSPDIKHRQFIHSPTGCQAPGKPVWLGTWLMIIADNTVHLVINAAAVLWL